MRFRLLNALSCLTQKPSDWGQGTNPDTWHWHCNTRLHNLNKYVVSLLLYVLQFDQLEFTIVSSHPVFHAVFYTGLFFLGCQSCRGKGIHICYLRASQAQDLIVVGNVWTPEDSPSPKGLILQFLNIPKTTPDISSRELVLCTVSLKSLWCCGAAQKAL